MAEYIDDTTAIIFSDDRFSGLYCDLMDRISPHIYPNKFDEVRDAVSNALFSAGLNPAFSADMLCADEIDEDYERQRQRERERRAKAMFDRLMARAQARAAA